MSGFRWYRTHITDLAVLLLAYIPLRFIYDQLGAKFVYKFTFIVLIMCKS
jgi:hypothetical protein